MKSGGKDVIYDFTRLNEVLPFKQVSINVVFIARDKQFHRYLDPAELSTLGRNYINFPNYRINEIVDILNYRVSEAFRQGAVSDEIIEYVANITSKPPVNGDIRYALDLLLFSGVLAEREGFERILPEHVRKVYGETHWSISTEELMNLPKNEKVVLLSIARALKNRRTAYVPLSKIREAYNIVCEEYHLKRKREIEEEVQDLCDRGIIDIKSLRKIGVNVETKKLVNFLENLINRLKKEI